MVGVSEDWAVECKKAEQDDKIELSLPITAMGEMTRVPVQR